MNADDAARADLQDAAFFVGRPACRNVADRVPIDANGTLRDEPLRGAFAFGEPHGGDDIDYSVTEV